MSNLVIPAVGLTCKAFLKSAVNIEVNGLPILLDALNDTNARKSRGIVTSKTNRHTTSSFRVADTHNLNHKSQTTFPREPNCPSLTRTFYGSIDVLLLQTQTRRTTDMGNTARVPLYPFKEDDTLVSRRG